MEKYIAPKTIAEYNARTVVLKEGGTFEVFSRNPVDSVLLNGITTPVVKGKRHPFIRYSVVVMEYRALLYQKVSEEENMSRKVNGSYCRLRRFCKKAL